MGIFWGNIGGEGGSSDISETYVTLDPLTTVTTVASGGSVVIPVNATGGSFAVTLNDNVPVNTRARIHDSYEQCGTNPVTIKNGSDVVIGKLNTDGGAIEFAWTGANWMKIDRFENMLDRDEITGEVKLREPLDTFVAGKMRTPVENLAGSVAGGGFINADANVDVEGGNFGNSLAVGDQKTPTSVVNSVGQYSSYGPTRLYDGDTSTFWSWKKNYAEHWIEFEYASPFSAGAIVLRHTSGGEVEEIRKIEGRNSDGAYTTIYEGSLPTNPQGSQVDDVVIFQGNGEEYNRYKITLFGDNDTHSSSAGVLRELYVAESVPRNDFNTIESTSALGSGSLIPSTLVINDENALPISGAGKVNVAYSVDGGAFVGGGSSGTTFYTYDIAQNDTGHSFIEHFKVTADEAFRVMVRKQTNGGDGTALTHYGTSAENATTDVEVQNLIQDALDDYGANNSGDSVTGNTDIVTAEYIASQDQAGTETVHIYLRDGSGNRIALTAGFEIVVDTDNNVQVEANYSNQAINNVGVTFSPLYPTSSGSVVVENGEGSSDFFDLEDFKTEPVISYASQLQLRFQAVGSQRVSSYSIEAPATYSEMTANGMETYVDGQLVSRASKDGLVSPSGVIGQAGTVSDQSVAGGDFANAGANVDLEANDFGNEFAIVNTDICTGGTAIASSEFSATYAITNAFDDDTGSTGWLSNSGEEDTGWVGYDFGSSTGIVGYRFLQFSASVEIEAWRFEGSDDGTNWTTLHTALSGESNGPDTWTDTYTFPRVTYRYIRIATDGPVSGAADKMGLSEIEVFDGAASSTLNTIDTNLATAASGTFTPSSFKAYDETDTLISGTGKVNVGYQIDGGGFVAEVDQDTFKALGNLDYSSQFDLRLQAVGAQRISRIEIATPDQVQEVGSDGSVTYKEDGTKYAKVGPTGFEITSKTTAERDALSVPASTMIYNSTTNKMNFYNGSAWEELTSS